MRVESACLPMAPLTSWNARATLSVVWLVFVCIAVQPEPAEVAPELIADALSDTKADWVLLLGYMKKMGEAILRQFSGRIINTHPALLPDFGGQGFFGRKVHEAVYAAGVSETGATLHIVGQEYDTGPIIAQIRVPVLSGDDVDAIEKRVKTAERKLLVDTLRQLEAGGCASL